MSGPRASRLSYVSIVALIVTIMLGLSCSFSAGVWAAQSVRMNVTWKGAGDIGFDSSLFGYASLMYNDISAPNNKLLSVQVRNSGSTARSMYAQIDLKINTPGNAPVDGYVKFEPFTVPAQQTRTYEIWTTGVMVPVEGAPIDLEFPDINITSEDFDLEVQDSYIDPSIGDQFDIGSIASSLPYLPELKAVVKISLFDAVTRTLIDSAEKVLEIKNLGNVVLLSPSGELRRFNEFSWEVPDIPAQARMSSIFKLEEGTKVSGNDYSYRVIATETIDNSLVNDGGRITHRIDSFSPEPGKRYRWSVKLVDGTGRQIGSTVQPKVFYLVNQKPGVPEITNIPRRALVGDEVTLAGTAWDEEDGNIEGAGLKWYLNNSAQAVTGDEFTFTIESARTYSVRLVATDQQGESSQRTIQFTAVLNQPPTVVISIQGSGPHYTGQPLVLIASAQDPEGRHTDIFWSDDNGTAGNRLSVTPSEPGSYTYTATAIDESGNIGEASVTVNIVSAQEDEDSGTSDDNGDNLGPDNPPTGAGSTGDISGNPPAGGSGASGNVEGNPPNNEGSAEGNGTDIGGQPEQDEQDAIEPPPAVGSVISVTGIVRARNNNQWRFLRAADFLFDGDFITLGNGADSAIGNNNTAYSALLLLDDGETVQLDMQHPTYQVGGQQ